MFDEGENETPNEDVLKQCYDEQIANSGSVQATREDSSTHRRARTGFCKAATDCNQPADNDSDVTTAVNNIIDFPMAYTQLTVHQKNDELCTEIWNSITQRVNNQCYYIKNNLVMYKKNNRAYERIVLPEKLINMVYDYYHVSLYGGHAGGLNTYRKISKYFYRPNLQDIIKDKVDRCELCLKCKPTHKHMRGPLISGVSKAPMDCLYIDGFGPLTKSSKQNKHVLLVLDDMTKLVWLFPMREMTSKKVIELLNERIFNVFSLPKKIVSDNASYFVSHEMKKFMFTKGIEHRTVIPYHPQGNKSERYMRNLKSILKIYFNDKQNKWDVGLSELTLSLNSCYNETTRHTPFEVMFPYRRNDTLTNKWALNDIMQEKVSIGSHIKKIHDVLKWSKLRASRNQRRHDVLQHDAELEIGATVYVKVRTQSNLAQGYQAKLGLRYDGPFQVLYRVSNVSYIVQRMDNPRDVRRVAIQDLKIAKSN